MYQKALAKGSIGIVVTPIDGIGTVINNVIAGTNNIDLIPYEDRLFYKCCYITDGGAGTHAIFLCDNLGNLLTIQRLDLSPLLLGITSAEDLLGLRGPLVIATTPPNDLESLGYSISDKFIPLATLESLGGNFYLVSSIKYNGVTYNVSNGKLPSNAVSLDEESELLGCVSVPTIDNNDIIVVFCQGLLISFTSDNGTSEYVLSKISTDTYLMVPLSIIDPEVSLSHITSFYIAVINDALDENDCMLLAGGDDPLNEYELLYFNDGKLNYTIPEYPAQGLPENEPVPPQK